MSQVPVENSPLEQWLALVTELQLPILDHSILQLRQLSENINIPPARLASIILQDPLLTARVLRMANSVYYNTSRGHIRTVSRAVIVLGFATVRAICLSSMVLDKFSQTGSNPPLIEELAWSFVAAFMLKALALQKGLQEVEELYIGALLYRIGPMMFWLSERPECQQLHEAMQASQNRTAEQIERKILGFSLNELGLKLLRGWNVSSVLNDLLTRGAKSVEGGTILVSLHQYIHALRSQNAGLIESSSQALNQCLSVRPTQLDAMLKQGILHTCNALKDYGAEALVEYLQRWSAQRWQGEAVTVPIKDKDAKPSFSAEQQQRQLAAIKDILTQLSLGPDINSLMQLLLEGLQQGAGFKRVVIALLDPSRSRLSARFVLAPDMESLQSQFQCSRMGFGRELIEWLISSREVSYGVSGQAGVFQDLCQTLNTREYLLAPLWGSSKAVALLYADNQAKAIGLHQQEAFRLFAMQASMVILWLEQQRSQSAGSSA